MTEYYIVMEIEWYTRKEIAKKLWISEQRVSKNKKVVRIRIKCVRNKTGYKYRYILLSDLEQWKTYQEKN